MKNEEWNENVYLQWYVAIIIEWAQRVCIYLGCPDHSIGVVYAAAKCLQFTIE